VRIEYKNGHIVATDDDGRLINGVRHATVSLNERGMSEAMLFFERVEVVAVGVTRASDGVRETRPEHG
jgi:hypothetical protein